MPNVLSLDALPEFIAVKYQSMLVTLDPKDKIRYGLEVFELTLRLMTIIMISQYLLRDRENTSDDILNKLIIERLRFGVLSDWLNVFVAACKVYEGHPDRLFYPPLYDIYWEKVSLDDHQPKESFMHLMGALLAVKNDLEDKKNQPVDDLGWSSLCKQVVDKVNELLASFAFLEKFSILRIIKASDSSYLAERCMGLYPKVVEFDYQNLKLQPNLYYLERDFRDFLLLDPLLTNWSTTSESIAVFKRMTKYDQLIYWLITENILELDESKLTRFISLIESTRNAKKTSTNKDRITWSHLLYTSQETTKCKLLTFKGNYDSRLYVQRKRALEIFTEFLKSDKACFVLTGKSGAGKSHFVVSLNEEFVNDSNICCLMVDAANDVIEDLEKYVRQIYCKAWGVEEGEISNFWSFINDLRLNGKTFLLVLDGINENQSPRTLLRQVNDLIVQSWPWLKILITSRPEAWERICFGLRLAEPSFFRSPENREAGMHPLAAYYLSAFDWSEVQKAYTLYKEEFHIRTSYDQLSAITKELIREPIRLWIVAQTFDSKEVPDYLPEYTLISHYISSLMQTSKVLPGDITKLLKEELVPLFVPSSDHLLHELGPDILSQAGGFLYERVFDESQYSSGDRRNEAIHRLADASILRIKQVGEYQIIDFKYERFYDHFLGEYVYQKFIANATNRVSACQQLISLISQDQYAWGVIERALLFVIENHPDVVVELAYTNVENLSTGYLISKIIEEHATLNRSKAMQVLNQIASNCIAKKSPYTSHQKLNAAEVALRVAKAFKDVNIFRDLLLSNDKDVQAAGIRYLFFLNKSDPSLAIEVLAQISQRVTQDSLGINVTALNAIFRSAPLLIIDCYQNGELGDRDPKKIISIFRDAICRIVNQPLVRWGRPMVKTWIIQAFVGFLVELSRHRRGDSSKASPTVNSLDEFRRFFIQPASLRANAVKALDYLDRTKDSDEIVDVVIDLYKTGDRISEMIADYIVDGHGVGDPVRAKDWLFKSMEAVSNQDRCVYLFLTARWYTIMDRQSVITKDSLDVMKLFVEKWLRKDDHGIGTIFRHDRLYQYHPLNFYGALWTRAYPGQQIDLFDQYVEKAESQKDMDLLLHIIDSYGDTRVPLYDYRSALRSISPYVQMEFLEDEKNAVIREHLMESLGSVRGLRAADVDHFLLEADAPRSFANEVRMLSYSRYTSDLYMRFSQLLSDVWAYAPIEFVKDVSGILHKALKQTSFEKTAASLFGDLMEKYAFSEKLK